MWVLVATQAHVDAPPPQQQFNNMGATATGPCQAMHSLVKPTFLSQEHLQPPQIPLKTLPIDPFCGGQVGEHGQAMVCPKIKRLGTDSAQILLSMHTIASLDAV